MVAVPRGRDKADCVELLGVRDSLRRGSWQPFAPGAEVDTGSRMRGLAVLVSRSALQAHCTEKLMEGASLMAQEAVRRSKLMRLFRVYVVKPQGAKICDNNSTGS